MCAPVLPCGSSGGFSCITARASAIATVRRRRELARGLVPRSPPQQVRPCHGLEWAGSVDSERRGKLNLRFLHVRVIALPVLSSARSSFCSGAMANVSVPGKRLSSSFLPRMSSVGSEKGLALGAPWPFRSASQDPFLGLLFWKNGLSR